MGFLVQVANGNLTTAATWGQVDHNLVSTSTGTTTLTTVDQDSPAFTVTAVALIGVVIRLAQRTAGAATNKISVNLRNTTRSTDNIVVANVSDLPACTAGQDSEGGWHFFKFSAPYTTVSGTDNHILRIKLDSTSTPVQIATNGTGLNWQRIVVKQSTAAPAASDDMFCAQTLDGSTNPATLVARTLTMDNTATTSFGSGVSSLYQPGFSISKACTCSYGTTAATNYYLRLACLAAVYSGGTWNIGSSGAEIPRDSTAILEFNTTSDGQFGFKNHNGGTFNVYGLSRTAAKEVWKTSLSADVAAAATTINVTNDTGWKSGDEVALASTTRTAAQTETRLLNADAGASSFVTTVGVTNAHLGSGDYIGEVVLLTRNVEIRSINANLSTFAFFLPTSVTFCSWMRWRYHSSLSQFFTIFTTTGGSLTFQKCCFRDSEQGISTSGSTHGSWTFDQCVIYTSGGVGNGILVAATTGTWTVTDVMFFYCPTAISFSDIGGTIGNLWVISCNGGIVWGQAKLNAGTGGPTFPSSPTWTMHSNGTGTSDRCIGFTASTADITFPRFVFWRNNSDSIELDQNIALFNVEFTGNFFGNGVSAAEQPCCFIANRTNPIADLRFVSCNISGDSLYQANWGILFDAFNTSASEVYFDSCVFSENTGTRKPLLVADIGAIPDLESGSMQLQGIAENCTFGAPESIKFYYATGPAPRLASKYSYILCPRYNQTNALHRTYTPYGTIIIDTSIFDATPSQNIKPIGGLALGIDSNAFRRNTGFMVAVNSAGTVTPSVKVYIDGTYNGSTKPQLVVLKNRAAGITSDTVLATHTGATGSFQTLSGTTAAVSADCILEFVVRCYGTAGNAYVDTWSTAVSGQDATGDKYWFGQPVTNANTSSGGAGATPSSAAYLG